MKPLVAYTAIFLNFLIGLFGIQKGSAQIQSHAKPGLSPAKPLQGLLHFSSGSNGDLFGKNKAYIENVGQYGDTIPHYGYLGPIKYGFEGANRPMLITSKGLVLLQNATKKITHEEQEALERKGMREEEIEKKGTSIDRVVTMEWIGGNSNPMIVPYGRTAGYHTYGTLTRRAYGYTTILFKEVYPGVDVRYSFNSTRQAGIEYSIIARPGADVTKVRLRIAGDAKSVRLKKTGDLMISSDIASLSLSKPVCYYLDPKDIDRSQKGPVEGPNVRMTVTDKVLSFIPTANYDPSRTIVIDPFISGTSNLVGANVGNAKDVNFDYAGNVYVAGGGNQAQYNLAKYDPTGTLLWTFTGDLPGVAYLPPPGWVFGQLYGGWTVDKNTGYTYLGQGINTVGAIVVRLDANGQYDNFFTNRNPSLLEMWKLFWTCNGGQPQILTCGGSTSSNDNFGLLVPPSTNVTPVNITGVPDDNITGGCCQDIADIVMDPKTNEIYTYFCSVHNSNGGTAAVDNHIYKHSSPYTASNILWNVPSGYLVLSEAYNRPYMGGVYPYTTDNSANILAVNSSFLFYWDGVNLQAYNKATGARIGTPISITTNQPLMQGGIYADECNHVFVGSQNGTIKVYLFNGSTFDDAAAPDINILGYGVNAVYDLAFDNARQLLYASGAGFVAAFDISAYCPSEVFSIQVNSDCSTGSAQASISPSPPAGSIISYSLSAGSGPIGSNTSGLFPGLIADTIYTLKATINEGCSGIQLDTTFSLPQSVVTATTQPATCGNSNGSLTASATRGTPPYSYSLDGIHFQSGTTFNNLASGTYTITVRDFKGCTGNTRIAIANQDGPTLNVTSTNATCGNTTGTITATSGGAPGTISFSIDNIHFQSSGTFTGLSGGNYTVYAINSAGCTNSQPVTIVAAATSPFVFGSITDAICNVQQGTILAQVTGGTSPYQYSLNGQPLQSSPVFPGLSSGNYSLSVLDANGCSASTSAVVQNICIFSASASSTNAECGGYNGSLTISVVNGTAPYTYSIDGITFQTSNTFNNLAPGPYSITVKDATGTTTTTTVVVSYSCPSVTLTGESATCGNLNGTITATGANGTEPFQYSIDGINFQAGNVFTGLAPGIYTVTAKDAKGFSATAQFTIYTSCPVVTAVGSNATCGSDNGLITATGSGGVAPYQFSLDGVHFQTGNIFSNLAPGTYTVIIDDGLNAMNSTSIQITNIPGPNLSLTASAATCANNDGAINANGSGGTGGLQYSLDSVNFQSGSSFSNLATNNYVVTVRDANGCTISQNIVVPLLNNITLQLGGPDSICQGNDTTLLASTNANRFAWSPAIGLNDTSILNPIASPGVTTTYTVNVYTGPCNQTGSFTVIVRPSPIAKAGPDTTICYGTGVQFYGSEGFSYSWSPSTFLNDPNAQNPKGSQMTISTSYSLTVIDGLGCKSIVPASVRVTVTPPAALFAGNDTSILVNQPLQMNAVDLNNSGFKQYSWSPTSGLNNPDIPNPVAIISQDVVYTVEATTPAGCVGIDTISIKVFAVSDIFVPSGFTPNGDGHNDILRAIPIGIKDFKYFAVLNRWGQRIFYTSNPERGWDGTISGTPQGTGTYVWMAEGVDFHGKVIAKKGTVVLIR